jgi:uncharacterized protein (DUF2267 family)
MKQGIRMTITLRPEHERVIDQAIQAGVIHDAEEALEIAVDTLRDRLSRSLRTVESKQPLADKIRDIWRDMPDEVRVGLPHDGASQVDHYVHGLPKREP